MKKYIIGGLYVFGSLYMIGQAYNKGYKDGEENVLKLMDFANKVAEVVTETGKREA